MTTKGFGQRPGYTVYRCMILLHNLKQSRLCFGRGSIDLICQKQITKHGTGAVYKLPAPRVIHRKSQNITWQNVRCKLHTLIVHGQCFCKRCRKRCLANARNIFHQYMAATDDCCKNPLYHVFFTSDHLIDFPLYPFQLILYLLLIHAFPSFILYTILLYAVCQPFI